MFCSTYSEKTQSKPSSEEIVFFQLISVPETRDLQRAAAAAVAASTLALRLACPLPAGDAVGQGFSRCVLVRQLGQKLSGPLKSGRFQKCCEVLVRTSFGSSRCEQRWPVLPGLFLVLSAVWSSLAKPLCPRAGHCLPAPQCNWFGSVC